MHKNAGVWQLLTKCQSQFVIVKRLLNESFREAFQAANDSETKSNDCHVAAVNCGKSSWNARESVRFFSHFREFQSMMKRKRFRKPGGTSCLETPVFHSCLEDFHLCSGIPR